MAVKGLDGILNNIAVAEKTLAQHRRKAFTKIGLMVKADSVKMTPVNTGNLRGSAFSELGTDKVFVGYTAKYAPWVHENVEMKLDGEPRTGRGNKGLYWDGGEARFLAKSLEMNRKLIMLELADVKL